MAQKNRQRLEISMKQYQSPNSSVVYTVLSSDDKSVTVHSTDSNQTYTLSREAFEDIVKLYKMEEVKK